MKLPISVLLCLVIALSIASDEHRPKTKVKEDVRGKRNLEYTISHNYPIGSNFRLERRISSGSPTYQLPSRYPTFFPNQRPYIPTLKRGRPHAVPLPPYAVQMEPLVQYSQRDPLYDTNKLVLSAEGHNDLSKPEDLLTDNNHLSEHVYGHHPRHHNEPVYYQKEPEPIIEIIIKESNVTLPPLPVPAVPPKKREPVQVFYVKYKKNPNGQGKNSVIYDKPVPALTPFKAEDHEEPQADQPQLQEYVTLPPPLSTTLRTIIRPESETYIGTSGIHVTFGSEHKKHEKSVEGIEESAPQPAVIFPQHQQFSQPIIPERKPQPNAPFPPNFNAPTNFNQQFSQRPIPQNHQPHYQNNQYRSVQQQPARPPQGTSNHQQRSPNLQQRPFQSQQFPLHPPSAPLSQPLTQHRPPFNQQPQQQYPSNHQFHPNHQFPSNHQFSVTHQFPPNHQTVANHQFSGTPHSFQQQHIGPPPSARSQFPQIINQRPQTHFPLVQQPLNQNLGSQQQPLNHKVINEQNEQHQKQLQIQQQQHQQQLQIQQQQQLQVQQQHQQQQNQQIRVNHQIHQQQNQNFQQQTQQLYNHQHHNQQQHNQQQNNQQQHNQQQHNQQQHNQQQHNQQQHNQQQHNQQQHNQQQHNHQQLPHIIPPGGELLKSVPRYEQHISVPSEGTQIKDNPSQIPPTLPLIQNKPQASEQSRKVSGSEQNTHFNHQTLHNNQQIQPQSLHLQQQQQLQQQHQQQLQQQQLQQQLQQQIKQTQISQQSKHLSPEEYQQQIQQQFQIPNQNFAQLGHLQNKQSQQIQGQKQENFFSQHLSIPQQQQSSQNYFLQSQQKSPQPVYPIQQNNPSVYQTSPNFPNSTPKIVYQSTTSTPVTSTNKPKEKTTSEEKKKDNKLPANIVLPDEVPDDLREQLLSSGILSNADISVLDYDKVGDIPIDALPPDQLANFYGAGGAQQISASERKISVVKPDGEAVDNKQNFDQELEAEGSEIDEVQVVPQPQAKVDMKVVHYDSDTKQGQIVQESYVRDDATHVDPVVLNDNKYNRYLPLKVSGAQFPIPDVPELKGRNITSVVVLAPVDYEFQPHHSERNTRDIEGDIKDVRFLAGEALKQLIKEPTKENYKKWLERENQTVSDKQSVVLLVTGSANGNKDGKEIFMYDVASKTVSKLSGELSSAFVEAAESNVSEEDIESLAAASEIIETKIPYDASQDFVTSDLDDSASNIVEKFIDISKDGDLSTSASNSDNVILVSSGYSKTG